MNNVIPITIKTEGLTKEFDGLVAVDHVTLSVREGEVFGFLGPNGAGKTTLVKMLCTILNPTSGSAKVCGYDIVRERDKVRECTGIVFQDRAIDTFLTGKENLDFHARMYHLDRRTREKRIAEVLALLDLKGKENMRISECSGGTQRRFEVARGFLTHPKVLFLDEPTLGLDVQARRDLWDYIRLLNEKEGITIILTTHYMEEADYLCHRVAIIDHGRIVAMDTPEKLKQAVGLNLISLQVAQESNARLADSLKQFDWITKIEARDGSLELSIDGGEERIPELIDFADSRGFVISSIKLYKPSLEDTFLHYYTGRTIREEEGNLKEFWKAWMRRSGGKR
ncbi:MAG: ATP-binding cassette domain-containing protein [Chloroflexi bacterium]|nr:ATP-binding cassette domain-containing protein [Chloroflexota bacterium]